MWCLYIGEYINAPYLTPIRLEVFLQYNKLKRFHFEYQLQHLVSFVLPSTYLCIYDCVCACVYSLICNISMCELYNRQLWETTAVRVLTIHLPLAWVPADCLSVCLSVRQSVHLLKSTIIAWEFINKSHTHTLRNMCINICMYLLLFIRLTNKIVILQIKQNHWLVWPGPVRNPPSLKTIVCTLYMEMWCVCVCGEIIPIVGRNGRHFCSLGKK